MRDAEPLDAIITAGAKHLAAAGVSDARREARLLMVEAAALPLEDQIAGRVSAVPVGAADRFRALTERRAQGEPLARMRGSREFWSLDFELSGATLDPRPDSECLVETALARLARDKTRNPRILDLGTGSGCLLLALLHEIPQASGVGVDRSPQAVATARRNAARLGLAGRSHFVAGDWAASLNATFDVIVANPPYIPTAEIEQLPAEVRLHDPLAALDGGCDGLSAYRALAPRLPHLLNTQGFAVIELAQGAGAQVQTILTDAGLRCVGVGRDLSQIKRCIVGVSALAARPKKGLD